MFGRIVDTMDGHTGMSSSTLTYDLTVHLFVTNAYIWCACMFFFASTGRSCLSFPKLRLILERFF